MVCLVVKDAVEGYGVQVVEHEGHVPVGIGVLFLHGQEPDVARGAAVEGALVALVREVDLVVLLVVRRKDMYLQKKNFCSGRLR